jgi:hypothetical protein
MSQQPGYPSQYPPPQQPGQWQQEPSGQPATYGQPAAYGQPATYGQASQDQWQQPQGPPPKPRLNALAVVSFILGIFAFVGGVLFSVILGIVALNQIKRRGERGRGFAIAGLVLSGLWIVLLGVGFTLAVLNDADRNEAGEITGSGDVSSFALAPGDCINDLEESSNISSLPAVPCAQAHEGEVFAVFEITAASWPGDAVVAKQAEDGCVQRLPEYAPKAADDDKLQLFFLHPTQQSWAQGDHEVTCVAVDPAKRTGSLRD